MGALDAFLACGIRFELLAGDQVRAIGTLNDALRAEIRATKPAIIGELHWVEFERLLAIVGPAYRTIPAEIEEIKACARGDLENALISYRQLAEQVST